MTKDSFSESAAPFGHGPGLDNLLGVRFAAWLAARVASEDPTQPYGVDVEARRAAALDEATRLVLVTPCTMGWQVWKKFEILEEIISQGLRDGMSGDPLALVAVAAIKADLAFLADGSSA